MTRSKRKAPLPLVLCALPNCPNTAWVVAERERQRIKAAKWRADRKQKDKAK